MIESGLEQQISEQELNFLDLNPQLRSAALKHFLCNIENIRFVSERLQNLESIEFVVSFPDETNNELIHFKNVKKCSIGFRAYGSLEQYLPDVIPFVFDRVEEMEIDAWAEGDSWKEFITRHKTLKAIEIAFTFSGRNLIQLMSIISENLPNLIEMKITFLNHIDDEMVERIASIRTNLKKIVMGMPTQAAESFREHFDASKWIIATDDHQFFWTLSRKEIDS